jgi:hypothetical protein
MLFMVALGLAEWFDVLDACFDIISVLRPPRHRPPYSISIKLMQLPLK